MKSQLKITAYLLLIFIVIGIAITLFAKFGVFTKIFQVFAVVFDSIMALLRGILIKGMWSITPIILAIGSASILARFSCYSGGPVSATFA